MKNIIKCIYKNLEEILIVTALLIMVVVMGLQVFSRYILSSSLSWSEELTRYLFIWIGFMSISFCIKCDISIKIDQLLHHLSKSWCSIIKICVYIVEIILFIYLLPFAVSYLRQAVSSGQISPAMGIKMYYLQIAPAVAFSLSIIRIIEKLIKEICSMKIGKEG